MLTMDKVHVRSRFFVKGEKISQIAKVLQLDWKTVQKYVDMTDFNEQPPKPASEIKDVHSKFGKRPLNTFPLRGMFRIEF